MTRRPAAVFLVTIDWYFWSHRLPIAKALQAAGFRVVVACRVSSLAAAMRAEGFEVAPIPIGRAFGWPWTELRCLFEIFRLYRREKPVLVQQVSVKCALYGTVCARLAGVPAIVSTLPGLGYLFHSRQLRARVLRPLAAMAFRALLRGSAVRVIVQNKDDEALLAREGLVPQECLELVQGSGVDVERFAPRPEPSGTLTVAMVSRMLWDKGVRELVEAGRLLRRRGRPVRILLVGAPDPENPGSIPAETLASWNSDGSVEWSGAREDVPAVWAEAHIAALPSYYGEGLPKSLLEACACGRPVVAADVAGSREIVHDGENGLLVPPRDVSALADALERLAADAELRRRMGARGRQIAEAEFAEHIVVERTLAVYRNLLGDRFPRP